MLQSSVAVELDLARPADFLPEDLGFNSVDPEPANPASFYSVD